MTKRIKRKISLLLLNIQLLFTFFLPLSPLVSVAKAADNSSSEFRVEDINQAYTAYYLVDGVVFAENGEEKAPSFASQSGEDLISYAVDRFVIKTVNQTYLLLLILWIYLQVIRISYTTNGILMAVWQKLRLLWNWELNTVSLLMKM
jgi:hypothetical protein